MVSRLHQPDLLAVLESANARHSTPAITKARAASAKSPGARAREAMAKGHDGDLDVGVRPIGDGDVAPAGDGQAQRHQPEEDGEELELRAPGHADALGHDQRAEHDERAQGPEAAAGAADSRPGRPHATGKR